jgi:hypoxanthine phosphoribosyltransferase
VAARITEEYERSVPLMVCVLNGAAIFHADLIRMMPIPLEVDYIRVASYHGTMASSGTIIFTAECSTRIEGRRVIIVEDIVDTGRTVQRLREYFIERGAASVAAAALLYKREADIMGREPEFLAFAIPNRFVVGFGLDYGGEGRNLPAIYMLEDEV